MTVNLPSIPPDSGVPGPRPSGEGMSSEVAVPSGDATPVTAEHRNEVRLVGLVVVEPSARALPDGDVITSWRVAVERPTDQRRPLVGSDTVTCATADPEISGIASTFTLGDTVELSGALRRRAWRTTTGVVNFYEVEVGQARLVSSILLAGERRGPRPAPPT